jgi:hypothetical protein
VQSLTNVVFTIEPALNLIYYLAFGSVEGRDLLAAEQAAWHDPRRKPGMNILVDVVLVTALSYELEDHKNLLALNQKLAAEGLPLERTAFLGRHDFDLTMGDAISMTMEHAVPVNMAVFLHLREAVNWLGLCDDYPRVAEIQRTLQLAVGDRHA